MVVQPGIGWQDVNAELAKRGIKMFFPVSLSAVFSSPSLSRRAHTRRSLPLA